VKIRSPGPSGQLSCDYLFLLSEQRREQFSGRILTLNGSKNAESLKNVPFGSKMKNYNPTPIYPQNFFFFKIARIGNFQPKY